MRNTLTIRTDTELEMALTALTADGRTKTAVVKDALLEAFFRLVRQQAEQAAADPGDRAEAQAILAEMDTLRAW